MKETALITTLYISVLHEKERKKNPRVFNGFHISDSVFALAGGHGGIPDPDGWRPEGAGY